MRIRHRSLLWLTLAGLAVSGMPFSSVSLTYVRSNDEGDAWEPHQLDSLNEGVGAITQVASVDGTVHAIFATARADDGVNPNKMIYRRSDNAGHDFGPAVQLDDDGGISSEASLHAEGETVHVLWEELRPEFADELEEVYYVRSTDDGQSFSAPINLSDTDDAQERDSDVEADGDQVAAVYESADEDINIGTFPDPTSTDGDDVVVKVSHDGGATWEAPINLTRDSATTIHTDSAGDVSDELRHDEPAVGVDENTIIAVFRVGPPSDDEDQFGNLPPGAEDPNGRLGYVRSTDGGMTFDPDVIYLPGDVFIDNSPGIYFADGVAHVLGCHDADPAVMGDTNQLLYWRSPDAGATWEDPAVLHSSDEPCDKPVIAGSPDDPDKLHIAFEQDVHGTGDIFYIHGDDQGDDFDDARNLINNYGSGRDPAIAVDTDDDNDVFITWQDGTRFLFTLKYDQRLPTGDGDEVHVANQDIVEYRGGTYSKWFNGSDVGLRRLRIDGMAVLGPVVPGGLPPILLSFTEPGKIPDVGWVEDSDIVRFDPTSLGSDTAGTFSLYFDGSDIGLTGGSEDVYNIETAFNKDTEKPDLYLTTYGNFEVYGGVEGKNEDVFSCRGVVTGPDSGCDSIELVFDGSERDLTRGKEALDVFSFNEGGNGPGARAFFSSKGDSSTATAEGEEEDLFSCTLPEFDDDFPESETNFDGDLSDCGTDAAPFHTTFLGKPNFLRKNLMSVDLAFCSDPTECRLF